MAQVIAVFGSAEECLAAAAALRGRQFEEFRIQFVSRCTLRVDVLDQSYGAIANMLKAAGALDLECKSSDSGK
jgi:hypothetical protein